MNRVLPSQIQWTDTENSVAFPEALRRSNSPRPCGAAELAAERLVNRSYSLSLLPIGFGSTRLGTPNPTDLKRAGCLPERLWIEKLSRTTFQSRLSTAIFDYADQHKIAERKEAKANTRTSSRWIWNKSKELN